MTLFLEILPYTWLDTYILVSSPSQWGALMQAGLPPSFSCLETQYLFQPSCIWHFYSLTLIFFLLFSNWQNLDPWFLGSKGRNGESMLSAHCRKAMDGKSTHVLKSYHLIWGNQEHQQLSQWPTNCDCLVFLEVPVKDNFYFKTSQA